MKHVLTAEIIEEAYAAGQSKVAAPRGETVVTPAAWSRAGELRITVDQGPTAVWNSPRSGSATRPPPGSPKGACTRVVDASGVVVVRGGSVELGEFTGAGPNRNVGLLDVVTAADGAPMAAGFMAWSSKDSFPWHLDYAEIDLVVEGVLHLGIDGRVLEGRKGDVFYIPKGSQVFFGTPSRTRLFYVTYPANWAEANAAPVRPRS